MDLIVEMKSIHWEANNCIWAILISILNLIYVNQQISQNKGMQDLEKKKQLNILFKPSQMDMLTEAYTMRYHPKIMASVISVCSYTTKMAEYVLYMHYIFLDRESS